MATDSRLTSKQTAAIRALLDPATPSIAQAAKAAGVSETTLYRWMHEPDFSAALADAQGQAIGEAVRSLTALSQRAIAVVHSVLNDVNASPSARLRAATVALEMLLRLKDSHDFEVRLRALESRGQ